jgi:hypothetical protein
MRKEGFAGKPIEQHPSSIIREKTDDVHPLSINGQLMKKDARIAELEAALKPFADEAQFFVPYAYDNHLAAPDRLYLTIGQFRAARKVLGEKE